MGKQIIQFGILFALCSMFISACATTTPTTSPVNATVAALSTDVARNSTMVSYLATMVNAVRAGTPTPLGFMPTMTPWFTPTPQATSTYLIEYSRAGGIAGFNDELKIDAKGHVTLVRRTNKFEFDLTADELNRLQAVFRDVGFASMPEVLPKPLVPDEFSYTISYQGRTIKTSDTTMPANLRSVITLLNNIIDAKSK